MNPSKDKRPALAKISRPRLDRPVPRPRLFARLDASRSAAITWVTGPPGAGKTTLVSSYLVERSLPALWYQLDADDADAATFFHYLGLAAQQATASGPLLLPALTPEQHPGLMSFTRRYGQGMAASLPLPAVIVLDNCEALPAHAVLHDVLRELAASLPPGLGLVVLSRSEPPPIYARLRLHGELVVLGGTELDLTRDEAASLAAARAPVGPGVVLAPARLDRLLHDSQGWLAGFALLLAEGGERSDARENVAVPDADPDDRQSLGSERRRLLFDYFATELFERLAPSSREAMMRTALLPTMTVADAEHLSGDPAVGSVLEDLQRQNCFIVQRGQQQPVYEFHALFRAFLLSRAVAQIPAAEWRALQGRAAERLVALQPDAAASLYRQAQAWPGLAALVLGEAASLVSSGRHRTLANWLDYLPGELVEASAWLNYWRGAARLPFEPTAAREDFERAYRGFQHEDDAAGLYATWASVMESFFFEWRDFRPADRWIAEFERLRARHPVFPSRAVELRTYWAMGTLLHRQPQHPLLPAWSERALAVLDGSERELSVLIAGYLVIWCLWRGERHEAAAVIQRVAPWCGPEMSPMVFILWSCAVGFHHSVEGETDACRKAVEGGLELAQRAGLHAFDFLLCAQMARSCLVAGELAAADGWLATMASNMRSHSHIDGGFYRHLQCNAALQRADWPAAQRHARAALAMGLEAGVPFIEAFGRIDLARALVAGDAAAESAAAGSLPEWARQLQTAQAIGQAMGSPVIEGHCLETRAMAELGHGDDTAGLATLAEGLAISRRIAGTPWQMAGPVARARLCERALAAGIEVEHVRGLVRRHGLVPADRHAAPGNWPWPVRVYTLGRFEILVDGEPLRSVGKAQRKPLELLKSLCAFGGLGVSQDRITDALWPDTEGDGADQALRTTLHRLRKLLHHEQAVRSENRQLLLDPHLLWADCLAFDHVAHQLDGAGRMQLQWALSLYQGPFLQGESAPWALAFRERLRSRFFSLAERLGALLEAQGDLPATIECCLRVIELEPAGELFYRRLMACHARLGQRAEALAVYQRCRGALLSRLGVSPGEETQALYRLLVDC